MGKIFEAFKRAEEENPKFTPSQSLEPSTVQAAPLPDESEQIVADAIERAVSGAAISSPAGGAETASVPGEPDNSIEPACFDRARVEPRPAETDSAKPGLAGPVVAGADP